MEHGEQLSHSSLPPHRSRCGSVEQPDEPVVEGRALGEQSLGWSRRSPQWWSLLLSSLTEVRWVVVEAQQLSHGARGTRPLCCGRHWRGRTGRHVEERPKVKAMETIQRFGYPPLEISLEPVSKVVLHLYFGRRNHTIHLSNGSHIAPHKMSNTPERTLFSRVLSPPLSCSLVLGYHVACVGALGCG
jgi:hypothetical protein